jgi:hypothetical protein
VLLDEGFNVFILPGYHLVATGDGTSQQFNAYSVTATYLAVAADLVARGAIVLAGIEGTVPVGGVSATTILQAFRNLQQAAAFKLQGVSLRW